MTGLPVLPCAKQEPSYGYRDRAKVEDYSEIWVNAHAAIEELDTLFSEVPACYDPDDAIADCLTAEQLGFEPTAEDIADLELIEERVNLAIGFIRSVRQRIYQRHKIKEA